MHICIFIYVYIHISLTSFKSTYSRSFKTVIFDCGTESESLRLSQVVFHWKSRQQTSWTSQQHENLTIILQPSGMSWFQRFFFGTPLFREDFKFHYMIFSFRLKPPPRQYCCKIISIMCKPFMLCLFQFFRLENFAINSKMQIEMYIHMKKTS